VGGREQHGGRAVEPRSTSRAADDGHLDRALRLLGY
jgi:hypothetical protein